MSELSTETDAIQRIAEQFHRQTCAEPWDACCWSGEDPALGDCHDGSGAWRPTGLEAAALNALGAYTLTEWATSVSDADGTRPRLVPAESFARDYERLGALTYSRQRLVVPEIVTGWSENLVSPPAQSGFREGECAPPACGCSCHRMPGVSHVAPCCDAPPLTSPPAKEADNA